MRMCLDHVAELKKKIKRDLLTWEFVLREAGTRNKINAVKFLVEEMFSRGKTEFEWDQGWSN